MDNFIFHVPTKIYFGKDGTSHLPTIMNQFGNNVLLVYGGGSVKRSGLYDDVMCKLEGKHIIELGGIDANPRIESVVDGANLCREHNIDVILAVGGGSVCDCSKAIAGATYYEGEAWDMILDASKITKSVPVVSIITLSGTGSEMNCTGVITNKALNDKRGFRNPILFPVASILDPTLTYTLPKMQTAAGCADTLSHLCEIYFNRVEGAMIQEELCHGLMKSVIKYGPVVVRNPEDYEARSNIMWAATLALNTLPGAGFAQGWSCHPMQHVLGAMYDNTHGIGLAILTPAWMRYILDETTVSRFVKYGVNVWGIDATKDPFVIANEAIDCTQQFLVEGLEIPKTFHEVGIDDTRFDEMADIVLNPKNGVIKGFKELRKEDVISIYNMCK